MSWAARVLQCWYQRVKLVSLRRGHYGLLAKTSPESANADVVGIADCKFDLNSEFLVDALHYSAPITSLPFVHTARRSYRWNAEANSVETRSGGSKPTEPFCL